MEFQSWIFGQIVIDIGIVLILLTFIFFHFKMKKNNEYSNASLKNAEEIISEMEQITQLMGKNLEEKRELNTRVVAQLEQVIAKAEKTRKQLQKIVSDSSIRLGNGYVTQEDMENTRQSINELLNKGISQKEISRHLGISQAEIDLFLKLHA